MELGDLASDDIALAAGFVLSYVSIYCDELQETAEHVETSLTLLAA